MERIKQERAEGKPYYDANVSGYLCTQIPLSIPQQVSQQMKALNKRFGTFHGLSSLANLFVVIALLFHGLWIANVGLREDW